MLLPARGNRRSNRDFGGRTARSCACPGMDTSLGRSRSAAQCVGLRFTDETSFTTHRVPTDGLPYHAAHPCEVGQVQQRARVKESSSLPKCSRTCSRCGGRFQQSNLSYEPSAGCIRWSRSNSCSVFAASQSLTHQKASGRRYAVTPSALCERRSRGQTKR